MKKLNINKDTRNILALVAGAAALGIYLLLTTFVVAPDSCIFIDQATDYLHQDPLEIINTYTQHPGYSLMILATHSLFFVDKADSYENWIISSQLVPFLFRILSVIPFYLLCRLYFKHSKALCASIVMLCLPLVAHYTADGLSDSPHMFFVLCGYLSLLYGSKKALPAYFLLAGALSGIAYLIRPEGLQIAVCGILWLATQAVGIRKVFHFKQIASAAMFLIFSTTIFVLPFAYMKGGVLTKKKWSPPSAQVSEKTTTQTAGISDLKDSALAKIHDAISSVLHWYFFPISIIGFYSIIKRKGWSQVLCLYPLIMYSTYIAMLSLLYNNFGYISKRHTICMSLILCAFVPQGAEFLACIINNKKIRKPYIWIIAIGIAICVPKLFKPLNYGNSQIFSAIEWVNNNTIEQDSIVTTEGRINLYGTRGKVNAWKEAGLPTNADYFISEDQIELESEFIEIEQIKGRKTLYVYQNRKKEN